VNIEKYFDEVDPRRTGLMHADDLDKLIIDFIGIQNMSNHDFKILMM